MYTVPAVTLGILQGEHRPHTCQCRLCACLSVCGNTPAHIGNETGKEQLSVVLCVQVTGLLRTQSHPSFLHACIKQCVGGGRGEGGSSGRVHARSSYRQSSQTSVLQGADRCEELPA